MAAEVLISELRDLPECLGRCGGLLRFARDEARAIGYTLEQMWAWQPPAKAKRFGILPITWAIAGFMIGPGLAQQGPSASAVKNSLGSADRRNCSSLLRPGRGALRETKEAPHKAIRRRACPFCARNIGL